MKRIISILVFVLCLCATMLSFSMVAHADSHYPGSGTEGDPFLISTCQQLQDIDANLSSYFKLAQSFSCADFDFTPIANGDVFDGTLDGDNHEISDLTLDSGDSYQALFYYIDVAGVVKNLTISNISITTTDEEVGGVVAYNDGTLTNVHVTGSIEGGTTVGGVAGYNNGTISHSSSAATIASSGGTAGGLIGSNDGTVTNCYSTGEVTSSSYGVGGFVGQAGEGTISQSYSIGDVTATDGEVGGFVGFQSDGVIEESYATGDVSSDAYYNGGFAGLVGADGVITNTFARGNVSSTETESETAGHTGELQGTLSKSYATGNVSGGDDTYVGGFNGYYSDSGISENNFWDIETSGTTHTEDTATGEETADMKNIGIYVTLTPDVLSEAWDFSGTTNDDAATDDIWTFINGENDGYPVFGWQAPQDSSSDDDRSASTTETPTGKTVMIHWSEGCDIDDFSVKAESVNAVQDVAYEYPNGLVDFSFTDCSVSSLTIDVYYFDVTNANYLLRKYTPTSHAYTTVSDAVLTATTVDGHDAIQATYTIVDNGPLDTNSAVGEISDPIGIAQAVLGAPRTGGGGTAG
jgi:hypothetical protein